MGLSRVAAVVMLGLALTACAPSGYYAPADPVSLRATAQAFSHLAEAYNSLAGQAELSRRATEQAYQAQITQTAQAYQATAQYLNLQATRQAVDATATANAMLLAMQSYQATATLQALERKAQEEQHAAEVARQRAVVQSVLETAIVFLALAALIALFVIFLYRLLDAYVRWQETRRSIMISPIGVLVVRRDGMPPVHVEVLQPKPELPAGEAAPNHHDESGDLDWIPYRVGDQIVGFVKPEWRQKHEDPNRRLALRLLREAIQKAGGDADYIPGWRELGWPAETWTKAVALLRPYVNPVPGRGGGTFLVGEYRTLAELYTALGAHKITLSLSPAPTEVA